MPRTYGKVKQTRLSFTPVASSPDLEHSPGSDRVANVRYEHPSKATISRSRLRIDDYPSFTRKGARSSKTRSAARDASTTTMNTPVKKSRRKEKKMSKVRVKEEEEDDDDDEEHMKEETSEDELQKSEVTRPRSPLLSSLTAEGSLSDDEVVQASARRRRQLKAVAKEEESESSSEGSTTPVQTMKSRKGKRSEEKVSSSRKLRSRGTDKGSGNREFGLEIRTPQKIKPAEPSRESRDGSESPILAASSSRTRRSAQHLSDEESLETTEEEEIVTRPTSRRRKRGAASSTAFPVDDLDDLDESEDLIVSSPAKRRRLYSGAEALRTPRQTTEQDRLDLEEDLEDLKDSAVKKTRTRGRLADSARHTRQKQLELLRRRRAGEKATNVSENELEEESDSEQDQSVQEIEDLSELERTENSDVEPQISENEDLDRYEEDFVLEDEETELGVPTDLADMPFEFTRHSYKQPKEFFRDVVEWMVHNKLNPAFPRNDPVYQVAFMKLEDEVKGRAGSQLVSTVWNSDFRRALMARPQIEVTLFPITEGHPCDACNRSGHPASFDIKLYGKPYSLETLEPLSDEEDSDEESEESLDSREKDREGNPLPDEDRGFYLGRHCKSRATMAHTLVHWRFHLNEWVIDYLERQGVFTDDKIIERSHWSAKRKTKYANEVVDSMVESGEVKRLWRDFHINLKAARETTESRW